MIMCKDERQQGKAIKMNIINRKKVECSVTHRKFTKGVITEILVNISVEDVKRNKCESK